MILRRPQCSAISSQHLACGLAIINCRLCSTCWRFTYLRQEVLRRAVNCRRLLRHTFTTLQSAMTQIDAVVFVAVCVCAMIYGRICDTESLGSRLPDTWPTIREKIAQLLRSHIILNMKEKRKVEVLCCYPCRGFKMHTTAQLIEHKV